jgi:hypothetical protein
MQFSLQTASPETFGYTLMSWNTRMCVSGSKLHGVLLELEQTIGYISATWRASHSRVKGPTSENSLQNLNDKLCLRIS